jgi:hypothetical protein
MAIGFIKTVPIYTTVFPLTSSNESSSIPPRVEMYFMVGVDNSETSETSVCESSRQTR